MKKVIRTLTELENFAGFVGKKINPGEILCLYGNLGSGKTTFTNYLVKKLGFKDKVQSPTFVIARRYHKSDGKIKVINHIDLYRITNTSDINDLSLEEYFEDKEAVTIIEWPEMAEEKLKNYAYKKVYFVYLNESSRGIEYED
ncbi:tRNA (adenosine(37)-N6)-threonylcarbamoyltransferase complex ATPase subunit type 1 TsaE [candidate division WWE3 bacterium RBG_19FT_COMBO_34_6]|uniref:tRNA threonylcarbamoyladenosine biosynthesis protein TsaE n=1 Tax=candidate division WWE3 bacterium RBG_19FT_COMBO_34_6 TaxID=1802612 RepID=A0A1F4UNI9_UNCKA|nr:MAG: tRNA (adenosine(37)-N6)-threonylcarbamoyltransferase complex ATPase subunit type 1 TsaE [candidate division WWE3 bacterium RBG_19FT_COMBO_34_6]